MFPKLRAKYGDRVTYVDSPSSHIIVEFSFDIVQVAAGAYLPEAYHSFIGFEVAKPLLERAFRETYGLEMKDVFGDEDLANADYSAGAVAMANSGPDTNGSQFFLIDKDADNALAKN